MEVEGSSKKMIAMQEEMVEARVPIPYRDQCGRPLAYSTQQVQAGRVLLALEVRERAPFLLVMERMLQMHKIREEEAKLKQGGATIPLIPKTANA